MSFEQPDIGGDKIPFKERGAELVAANSLMLIHVHEVVPKIKTMHTKPGEEGSDAVRADVVFLTGPLSGEYFGNALIFPKVLVSSLRNKVGKQVLGTLGFGQPKPGQNAAYTMMPFNDFHAQLAMEYLARFPEFGKTQPAEDVPEPPPGWGGAQSASNGWGGNTQTATAGRGNQTATAAAPAPPSRIDKMIARGAPGHLAQALQAAGISDEEIDRLPSLQRGWQGAQAGQIMAVFRPQPQGWSSPQSNEPPF